MSGCSQICAFLRKNEIEKRRNLRTTCCECCSHLIIIMLLVFGYSMAIVNHYQEKEYATIDIVIPPNFLQKQSSEGQLNVLGGLNNILSSPLPVPTFDQYVALSQALSSAFVGEYSDIKDILTDSAYGQKYGNLLTLGALHFAPDNDLVQDFISYLSANTTSFSSMKSHVHESEGAAVDYILNHLDEYTMALIVINEIDPGNIDFTIRMNYTTLPNTNEIVNFISVGLNTEYQKYVLSGFLTLQNTITDWAFLRSNSAGAGDCATPYSVGIPFPTVAFDLNLFYEAVGFLLGLAMTMATLYPVSSLVKSIVEEKESKMREVMMIMGLREWAHDGAWFLTAFILFFWIALSCTLICRASFLPASNPVLLFIYFFVFCMSEITFAFLVSTFFSQAKLAAIFGPVILFCTLLPRFIFLSTNQFEAASYKYLASLLSPTAFSFAADILANYEYSGQGVQTYNMSEGTYSFVGALNMMILDFFIYGALAWYFDKVIPQQYGTAKHPLFFLSWAYWCSCFRSSSNQIFVNQDKPNSESSPNLEEFHGYEFQQIRVVIDNIVKVYSGGKVAVNGLSLSILENQITCLLGHNGAGKTTTISMLTGMIECTSGSCQIYGYDLHSGLENIRQLSGICPQQNVLFDGLTVKEHLMFFGKMKGFYGKLLLSKVNEIILEVGLTEKVNALSKTLSGGMKRKLCLAIAFIGDSKFVLLDEPTSGMDPYSRRSTWELLQKKRIGRVIVLTTHFMDEADILGDRIAIMSEGRLRCFGSSVFLKNRFGAGYRLTLTKQSPDLPVGKVIALVQRFVPNAILLPCEVDTEVVVQIPINSSDSFADLFAEIKAQAVEFGIVSYGISITSLEQVFISLAKESSSQVDTFPEIVRSRTSLFKAFCRYFSSTQLPIHVQINQEENLNQIELPQRNISQQSEQICDNETKHSSHGQEGGSMSLSNIEKESPGQLQHGDEVNSTEGALATKQITHILGDECGPILEAEHVTVSRIQLVSIQFVELIRKRFRIALRDARGFFFQILLPCLQIALVLAILMIRINPAGRSLTLNSNIFPEGAPLTTVVSNNPVLREVSALSPYSMNLVYENQLNTSEDLSWFLLDTYYEPHADRYGAFVFQDRIEVNASVNWTWVGENLPTILSNQALLNEILNIFDASQIEFETSDAEPIDISQSLEDALETLLGNGTLFQFNNNTILSDDIIDFLLGNSSNTQLDLGSVEFTQNKIVVVGDQIVLVNVSITISNQTFVFGNISIPIDALVDALPSGTVIYILSIPSNYTVMHNSTSPHGIAAFIGELNSAAYRACDYNNANSQYSSKNHPLPLTARETLENQVILSIFASLFILIPLCYIPAAFVVFLIKERVTKSKHLQLVSSVSPYLYWLSTYTWDMFLYALLTAFIMCTFLAYGKESSQVFIDTSENAFAVFLLLLVYGASSIPLSYIYSMAFSSHSTAQIAIMVINFMTGFVAVFAYFVMISIPQTKDVGEQIVHFFRFFPPYNVGEGLINVSAAYFFARVVDERASFFAWNAAGRNLVFMLVEAIGYMAFVLLTESSLFHYLRVTIDKNRLSSYQIPGDEVHPPDDDVIAEKQLVDNLDPQEHPLVLRRIRKTYPSSIFGGTPKFAVREISLKTNKGERFGLLGINGAGKTTTLGILTGDITPTSGEAYIGGFNILDPSTRSLIGYCPQVDPLLDLLTGYETLWFFGRIRGIPEDILTKKCKDIIQKVGLAAHANRPCGLYSGGNKRKLSLAIALIGDPSVLFLDEPSTGMDPEARRHMWDIIISLSANRSVVITTHSMEECEAICNRVGIMVSGNLKCLGTCQHLKEKYGNSYQLELRLSESLTSTVDVANEPLKVQHIVQLLQEASGSSDQIIVEEIHGSHCRIKLPGVLDLSRTFAICQQLKTDGDIVNYSLCQATLEQIFIRFAKEQEEEKHLPTAGKAIYHQVSTIE